MHNPYRIWLSEWLDLEARGAVLPLGGLAPPARRALAADAPRVLLFSPHPDDECVVGGLALRLMRGAGWEVVNVAVTRGSRVDRREARWRELTDACRYLGFTLVSPGADGLDDVHPEARRSDPAAWKRKVDAIVEVLRAYPAGMVMMPHDADWNRTHLGVHALVQDALAQAGDFRGVVIETEFWGAMSSPNLMVEVGVADLADLVAALSFHVGEVKRNPYHLRLPAWMQDNVRRGAELVGGQGGLAPACAFATLYRANRWAEGRLCPLYGGGRLLKADEPVMNLLGGGDGWKS